MNATEYEPPTVEWLKAYVQIPPPTGRPVLGIGMTYMGAVMQEHPHRDFPVVWETYTLALGLWLEHMHASARAGVLDNSEYPGSQAWASIASQAEAALQEQYGHLWSDEPKQP